jgi:hypothetical protein
LTESKCAVTRTALRGAGPVPARRAMTLALAAPLTLIVWREVL